MKKKLRDLTELDKAWMRRARRQGVSNAEIGAHFGQSAHWASRICVEVLKTPKAINKGKHRIWSDEEKEIFARLWADGLTGNQIGDYFGITQQAATKAAQRMSLPPRYKFLTNKQVAEIKRRVLAGERRAQVAAEIGVHYDTVLRLTREAGRRPPPHKKVDAGRADRMIRQGMSYVSVAKFFGSSDSAVHRAVQEYRAKFFGRAAA